MLSSLIKPMLSSLMQTHVDAGNSADSQPLLVRRLLQPQPGRNVAWPTKSSSQEAGVLAVSKYERNMPQCLYSNCPKQPLSAFNCAIPCCSLAMITTRLGVGPSGALEIRLALPMMKSLKPISVPWRSRARQGTTTTGRPLNRIPFATVSGNKYPHSTKKRLRRGNVQVKTFFADAQRGGLRQWRTDSCWLRDALPLRWRKQI